MLRTDAHIGIIYILFKDFVDFSSGMCSILNEYLSYIILSFYDEVDEHGTTSMTLPYKDNRTIYL